MDEIARVGIDLAKKVFHVADESPVRRALREIEQE